MIRISGLILIVLLAACNSGSNNNSAASDSNKSNTQYVPNVNGNLPDTTNSIPINGQKRTDSSLIDSSRTKDSVKR